MKPYTSIAATTALAAALAISIASIAAAQTSSTQEQARAALMVPDPAGVSSLGEAAGQASGNQATTGIATPPADQTTAPATSAAPAAPPGPIAAPPGPIGATLQTMPAKVSERNDLLDHLPTMSWPLPLNEQQRQQIYQAVMADKTQPAPGADTLKPAVFLSYAQTRDVRPLPPALSGIDGLQGLQYIKAKDKVLLVRPSNEIVVDQITM